MKISNNQLNRLLAAGLPSFPPDSALSPALRSRILADWRDWRSAREWMGMLRLFRLGLAFSCAVLVFSALLALREIGRDRSVELAVPNAVMNLAIAK